MPLYSLSCSLSYHGWNEINLFTLKNKKASLHGFSVEPLIHLHVVQSVTYFYSRRQFLFSNNCLIWEGKKIYFHFNFFISKICIKTIGNIFVLFYVLIVSYINSIKTKKQKQKYKRKHFLKPNILEGFAFMPTLFHIEPSCFFPWSWLVLKLLITKAAKENTVIHICTNGEAIRHNSNGSIIWGLKLSFWDCQHCTHES